MINLIGMLKSIIDLYNNRTKMKFHELKNLEAVKGLIEHSSSDFKKTVLTEYMDEELFFALTGIRTNAQSIRYYLELEKKLGQNFSWSMIGKAKSYIHFKDDSTLVVIVPKWEIYMKNLMKSFGILLILTSILLLFVLKNTGNTLNVVILSSFFIMVPILLFYLTMNHIEPVLSAIAIGKRLSSLEN
ncbi:MAG: hypothetical protein I8H66_10195 [Sphingobacteriia bacterium]|nr:hypothetical protein [Sphingobacteriia bacterium]